MKEVFMNPSINALTKLVDKRKNTDIAEFVEEGEFKNAGHEKSSRRIISRA